jgi:hypothetical protein
MMVTSLAWKRFDPFYELLQNSIERWGFRLIGNNKSEDYFTIDEQDQKSWVSFL